MNTWLSSIDSRCSYSVSQVWAFMFVVHTSNCHCQNCTRRAIYRLGIGTLIANILVLYIIWMLCRSCATAFWPINGARCSWSYEKVKETKMADFASAINNVARRVTQSNSLLSAAGESMSLRQGVMGHLWITTATDPMYMHHFMKIYILDWRETRTKPQLQVTCTENSVKVDMWTWEMRVDRQTDRQTLWSQYFATCWGWNNNSYTYSIYISYICVLCRQDWYGMMYSFADSKKKSNLMLSVFMPGNQI